MNFRLANASDDVQLRRLARETAIPGHIRMIYAREPNYFDGAQTMGDTAQVIVAEDSEQIVGVGCRTVNNLYVNGTPRAVGYLSSLRITESARNGTVLARGYAYLKQLHGDDRAPAYLTTIIDGNERARQILTSKRMGLPSYLPMGSYLTHVIPVRTRPGTRSRENGLEVLSAAHVPCDDVLEFLSKEGSRRQFFPVVRTNGNGMGMLASIGMDNLLVARKEGQVIGTMAVWNQECCKQYVVSGYSRLFQVLRPWLNAGLRTRRRHPLPPPGAPLRYVTAALVCIRNDDPEVFQQLIQRALHRAAGAGFQQFALGMHEHDPLRACMRKVFQVTYRSQLYLVCWEDHSFYGALDKARIPYLELGAL